MSQNGPTWPTNILRAKLVSTKKEPFITKKLMGSTHRGQKNRKKGIWAIAVHEITLKPIKLWQQKGEESERGRTSEC